MLNNIIFTNILLSQTHCFPFILISCVHCVLIQFLWVRPCFPPLWTQWIHDCGRNCFVDSFNVFNTMGITRKSRSIKVFQSINGQCFPRHFCIIIMNQRAASGNNKRNVMVTAKKTIYIESHWTSISIVGCKFNILEFVQNNVHMWQ